MGDERLIITAAEAESLLPDRDCIHNMSRGPCIIGADWDRKDVIAAFKAAVEIEISGPLMHRLGHPIAVFEPNGRLSFFEADMTKVEAFEAVRSKLETGGLSK
jgi:hypothetical protein